MLETLIMIVLVLLILGFFMLLVKRELDSMKSELALNLTKGDDRWMKMNELFFETKNIFQLLEERTKEISSIRDIFARPKSRGGVGEAFLEDILKDFLPPHHYARQVTLPDGKIADFTINYENKILAIDSKFPSDSFERFRQTGDAKEFSRSIRAKIDETAKYVQPENGTFDFALMFIPSEGIYYTVINPDDMKDDLLGYAHGKNVYLVSPHFIVPFLLLIQKGIKTTELQQNVHAIIKKLEHVRKHMQNFMIDFGKTESHLSDAYKSHQASKQKLLRLQTEMENLDEARPDGESEPVPETQGES